MQREENGYIVISCDFCGTDWDEVIPMIEGHHGSIICLSCLQTALDAAAPAEEEFDCAMCLQNKPVGTKHWQHSNPTSSEGLNENAHICWDDIRQAAKAFHKDKDIDFKWDPAKYPPIKS
ncbi:ClpX C4-type zinc finger [Poriferisphaera corsica]|uniref:ClpX C4-type zinc finger n=2 Tax=Poriferisphaera corsica TaxID=2528020 RepID=A0A517YWP2_9BACT|nr:ClpX C4-type zinc finger [Poriferisphaera corsica]